MWFWYVYLEFLWQMKGYFSRPEIGKFVFPIFFIITFVFIRRKCNKKRNFDYVFINIINRHRRYTWDQKRWPVQLWAFFLLERLQNCYQIKSPNPWSNFQIVWAKENWYWELSLRKFSFLTNWHFAFSVPEVRNHCLIINIKRSIYLFLFAFIQLL